MYTSQIEAMGNLFVNHNWNEVLSTEIPDTKIEYFYDTVFHILDTIAPMKEIKIARDEPPWMNGSIKTEIRKRNREYEKFKKSNKWRVLNKKCKQLIKTAKNNFSKNFVSNLRQSDPKTWMKNMKNLGQSTFEENTHWQFVDEEKDDLTLTNEIAEYFADISKNFVPVDETLLPIIPLGLEFISDVNCLPTEYEIYHLLKNSKKTCSVPRDIPVRIINEFLPELARPITNIYNQCITLGVFPTSWKTEYVNIIPKVYPPSGYGDLRNLSLTEFLSKRFEEFVLNGTPSIKGLMFYVEKFIDRNQFAVKGSSCSHALISIINFILKHTDDSDPPKAVTNLLADWSKAFNKVNHNIVMRILVFLGVPQWILRIILSYLKSRKMIVRFRGCLSKQQDIPGSVPQGTLLGVLYISCISTQLYFQMR